MQVRCARHRCPVWNPYRVRSVDDRHYPGWRSPKADLPRAIIFNAFSVVSSHEDNGNTDAGFVDEIRSRLIEKGVSVWLDRHDLVAGLLQKEIDRAVRLNDVVLLLFCRRPHIGEAPWMGLGRQPVEKPIVLRSLFNVLSKRSPRLGVVRSFYFATFWNSSSRTAMKFLHFVVNWKESAWP